MKKWTLFLVMIIALLNTSCKSSYYGGYAATPNLSINYNVEADLKLDTTKVLQASSTTRVIFGFMKFGDNTFSDAFGGNVGDREKSAATYKALNGTGFDIIVNPKYVVNIRKGLFIKKITATVAGYGAKVILK